MPVALGYKETDDWKVAQPGDSLPRVGGGRCLAVEQWIGSLIACGPRAVRIQKRLVIDWDRMSTTDAARAGIQAYWTPIGPTSLAG